MLNMPFGKHKGKRLEEIPRNYLIWLKRNVSLTGTLAFEVDRILSGKPIPENDERDIDDELNDIVVPF